MGITNQNILDTASTTFHAVFDTLFEAAGEERYLTYTEVIPTESVINELDILESMPVVREWEGEKEYDDIFAASLSITVTKKEKSFEIDRLKLVGDKTGAIGRRINGFLSGGNEAFMGNLAFAELVANNTCYDGTALFNGSHPRGKDGATQSNTSTTALSFAQHNAVKVAGASLLQSNGEPMGIAYDVLRVGPALEKLGKEITQSTERVLGVNAAGVEATSSVLAAASTPNVFSGGDMLLVVDPRMVGTYANYYYYHDVTRGPKPIVCFNMRAPEPQVQDQMDSEARFNRDKIRMSVEADQGYGPAAWQVAYRGAV